MADTRQKYTGELDAPVPSPDDPGGSHAKGYSADQEPGPSLPEHDPVPLATASEGEPPNRRLEDQNRVKPTGRAEPGDYSPNERLMGSDR